MYPGPRAGLRDRQLCSASSTAIALVRARGPAAADPGVDLAGLELPEPADLVGRHGAFGDPGVDSLLGYADVGCDRVGRKPRFAQYCAPRDSRRPPGRGLSRSYRCSTRSDSVLVGVSRVRRHIVSVTLRVPCDLQHETQTPSAMISEAGSSVQALSGPAPQLCALLAVARSSGRGSFVL
jgi:hypothetical protein